MICAEASEPNQHADKATATPSNRRRSLAISAAQKQSTFKTE